VYKNTPCTIEQLKDAVRQDIQAVKVDTFWESISEFGETHSSVLGCEKETIFSIDYEQVLFCIVPGMCIYIFKSLSQ